MKDELFEVNSHNLDAFLEAEMVHQPIDTTTTLPYMNAGFVLESGPLSKRGIDLQQHYSSRVFALMSGPQCARPIVDKTLSSTFLEYQEKIHGYLIEPLFVDFQSLQNGFPAQQLTNVYGQQLRPYICTYEILKAAKQEGLTVADWNEQNIDVVMHFNDKGTLHKLLRQSHIENELMKRKLLQPHTHIVPKSFVSPKEELSQKVSETLAYYQSIYRKLETNIKQIYERNSLEYTPQRAGIMVRPCWGGGHYGSFVVLCPTEPSIPYYTVKMGNKTLKIYSKEDLDNYIKEEIIDNCEDTTMFIITRFLDIYSSPGVNMIMGEGWYYAAPAHGQIFEGTSAVGTTSQIITSSKEKPYSTGHISAIEHENLLKMSTKIASYIAGLMCDSGGRGVAGIDFMLTGFFEHAFAQAVHGTTLEDEAVNAIALAELNARVTQSLLQRYTMLSIRKMVDRTMEIPFTYQDLIASFEGKNKMHFIAIDNYRVPHKKRADLLKKDHILAGLNKTTEGFYISMLPSEKVSEIVGVGIMASSKRALKFYHKQLHTDLLLT